jgi:hypothetical protein
LLASSTQLAFENEVRCETVMVFSRNLGHKVVTFRKVNKAQPSRHHDALELPDGTTVLLAHLCKGQKATVLQLPVSASVKIEIAERAASPVV